MIDFPSITDEEAREYVKETKKYNEIISRIRVVLEIKGDIELADYFCIRVYDLRKNIKDLIIPIEWVKLLAADKGIAPSWILTGEGNKKL